MNQRGTERLQDQLPFTIEMMTLSLISIISLLFVLYCFRKFKTLQTESYRLVSRILYFDLLYCLLMFSMCSTYLAIRHTDQNIDNYPIICNTQAFLINYSILGGSLWTTIVCHQLYDATVNQNEQTYKLKYTIIGFILPAIISLIPIFLDGYGTYYPMSQCNCFYDINLPRSTFEIYKLCFYYLPVWISFGMNVYYITLVVRFLNELLKECNISKTNIVFGLFCYPSILLFCWVLPDIILLSSSNSNVGYYFQGLGSLIGLLDSLAYCFLTLFKKVEIKLWSIELI